MNKLLFILCLLLLSACSDVPQEIRRSALYKELMHHYETIAPHEQKKEAALFLLKHMSDKYALFAPKADSVLHALGDSLQGLHKYPSDPERLKLLKDRSQTLNMQTSTLADGPYLTSKMLIEHINLSYRNWKDLANISKASFTDYVEYILPYRVQNEYINVHLTKILDSAYSCVKNALLSPTFKIDSLTTILQKTEVETDLSLMGHYPAFFSPLLVHKLKMSPRCDDVSVFYVHLFRALGVPAAIDYIPQWGYHPYMGHTWFSIKWEGNWHTFQPKSGRLFTKAYKYESVPKVYRRNYYGEDVDITPSHVPTASIVFKTNKLFKEPPQIAIFNKSTGFKTIAQGIRRGTRLQFDKMGIRVVYFVGYENKKGQFCAVSPPIYAENATSIRYLIPDYSSTCSVRLHRKYPLARGRLYAKKIKWALSPRGSRIEASNDNFKTVDTLLCLDHFNSYKPEMFIIHKAKRYRSVRFISTSMNELAEVSYFNAANDKLEGILSGNYQSQANIEHIFDANPLSWSSIDGREKAVHFTLTFEKAEKVSKMVILARNDGNHIEIGDVYELFVWDKGWKTLGRKVADAHELHYDYLPTGGLYWLRNYTKGREELPFMITKEGKQSWPGEAISPRMQQ